MMQRISAREEAAEFIIVSIFASLAFAVSLKVDGIFASSL